MAEAKEVSALQEDAPTAKDVSPEETSPKEEKAAGKFPPEIDQNDNDPSSGFYKIKLTIPDMKVKTERKGFPLKKVTSVTNGECKVQITESEIDMEAKIVQDSKTTMYSYNKKLPEDLKLKQKECRHELEDEKVVLKLAKVEKKSWGAYSDFFRKRPG